MGILGSKDERMATSTLYARSLAALFLCAMPVMCFAQATPQGVDLRYDTLRKSPDRNKTTPGNQFGDQYSFENGSLTFNVVDVYVPGNNDLSVEFRRVLKATDQKRQVTYSTYAYPIAQLSDWAIGLPKIQATFDAQAGWITADTSRPTKNCSLAQKALMAPPPNSLNPNSFPAHTFWNPPTIHFPDGGARLLLFNDGLMPVPTVGGPYFWITADHDVVTCIATLKNRNDASSDAEERLYGQGEGYLVKRADGTKYWFDWMGVEGKMASFSSIAQLYCGQYCQTVVTPVYLQQVTLALYPTRIEDRFGNWVTYTYSNKSNRLMKLDKIESNDGRRIDIAYGEGGVESVTSHGRTWNYAYDPTTFNLMEVANPDLSKWKYSGESHPLLNWPLPTTGPEGRCQDLSWTEYVNPDATAVNDTDFTGYTVESPSGAKAVFRIAGVMLGRSNVSGACYVSGTTSSAGMPFQVTAPLDYLGGYNLALTGKKVTGAGVTPMIWKYSYQSDIGLSPMATGSSRTKVLNPDGSLDQYVYGNTYNNNEGLLLSHIRSSSQQVLLAETNAFAVGSSTPGFPKRIGYHTNGDNRTGDGFLRPKMESKKVLQSRQFVWKVDRNCGTGTSPCLDAWGRPTKVTKSSSPAP